MAGRAGSERRTGKGAGGKPRVLREVEESESTSRANTPDVPASARDMPKPGPGRVSRSAGKRPPK